MLIFNTIMFDFNEYIHQFETNKTALFKLFYKNTARAFYELTNQHPIKLHSVTITIKMLTV